MAVGKHEHRHRPVSFSLDPRDPRVLYACNVTGCINTKVECVLCNRDGNRRKHKSKHQPVKDRDLFNEAMLLMTKVAMEHERIFGKVQKAPGQKTATIPLIEQRRYQRHLLGVSLLTKADPGLGDILIELDQIARET